MDTDFQPCKQQATQNLEYNQQSHEPSLDFICHLNQDPFKLSLPLPNFLIDPKDGQFTPYSERSPASTPDQEYDDPMDFHTTSIHSSPVTSISPVRSRATSIALQKMIEHQAQMLLDISTAWKKKYSFQQQRSSNHPTRAEQAAAAVEDLLPPTNKKPLGAIAELADSPQLPDSRQSPSIVRKMRSLSLKSTPSLSSLGDRLSLNEASHNKTAIKVDVESWKTQAIETKEKEASTRQWVDCLPSSDDFEDLEPQPALD